MSDLSHLRARLDDIDRQILHRLADRLRVIREVARAKESDHAPKDAERERALLDRLDGLADEVGLDASLVRAVYRTLLDHSVRMQEEHLVDRDNPERAAEVLAVGYQGTDGCYSHLAAMNHLAARATTGRYRGFESFRELLSGVETGAIDLALLPIENTTAGTLTESYDLLARLDLCVVGEEYLDVRHCLIALRPVPVSNIRRIRSHPMALAQCTRFLDGLSSCLVERYADTAMACDALLWEQDLSHAAIASEQAAERRGLAVIARDIGDQADNITRFVAVAREPLRVDPRIPAKTSVVFATRHEHGALRDILNTLADAGLNLTKLESRPRPGTAWEYLFYLDFEGNADEPGAAEALAVARASTPWMRVLGTYPQRPRTSA